eukprot:PhF_6_TR35768/c0_g1_i2/m.51974
MSEGNVCHSYHWMSHMSSLQMIVLDRFPDHDLASLIKKITPVRVLQVTRSFCEMEKSIQFFKNIPSLEELDLSHTLLSDVSPLSQCSALTKLTLVGCGCVTFSNLGGTECGGQFELLESINLASSKISTLVGMTNCPRLNSLNLSECLRLKNADIEILQELRNLKELDLSYTLLTSVVPLANCGTLRKLELQWCCDLCDAGIQGLERISTLEELDLSRTRITSVSNLTMCPALRKLSLISCAGLTDSGIRGLEAMNTLEELDLSGTKISDVSSLLRCTSLKVLGLRWCPNLKKE